MRAGIVVKVTRDDRRRLEAIVADRSASQKHVWRAKIMLATADGCGTAEIMRRSGKSKPVVWAWQARFMAEGVAGLLRDKTRKPGKAPLPPSAVKRVNAGVKLHRLAGAKLHQVGFDASWIGIRGTDGRCARSRARSSPAAAERRALGRGALRRERAPSHHSRAAMRAVV